MTQEAYCSYEVSRLLKEKGFDWECEYVIWEGVDDNYENYDKVIPNPTHYIAMKWLREKGIECIVIPIWNTVGKQYRSYVLSDLGDKYKDNYDSYSDYISYEDAVEAALKYSLVNLI